MSKRQLNIYIIVSVFSIILEIIWFSIYYSNFPYPIGSSIGIFVASQAFFWFSIGANKLQEFIIEDKKKIKETQGLQKVGLFIAIVLFGIRTIYTIIFKPFSNEPESTIFFIIPLQMTLGLYFTLLKLNKNSKV